MTNQVILESPCHLCPARCCHQKNSGWPFAVELVEADGDKFNEFAVYEPVLKAKVLPYNEQGKCHYLADDNRCSIHEDKPQTCCEFNCTSGHIVFLSRNPELLTLLEEMEAEPPKAAMPVIKPIENPAN